ncbi:MAG: SGNH/GDSL hydrolase family protein [Elusimicrobia bacterium]|nr:SGNH/GDSL hydrolase family protein [Elusimicrobiota bacterium]
MTSLPDGTEKGRRPRNFLLVFLGLGLGLGIAEAGLRLFGAGLFDRWIIIRHATPLPNRVTTQYHLTDYGYALNCDGTEGCNAFGGPVWGYKPAKAAGVYRILILGDSLTEQVPVAWEHPAYLVWAQYLEKALSSRGRYELLNGALVGFNLPHYLGYLRARIRETKPDLVVVSFCLNDVDRCSFVEMGGKITMIHSDLKVPFFADLFRISKLFQYIVLSLVGPSAGVKSIPPDRILAMLREMKTLAADRIAAVVFPPFTETEAYSPAERRKYEMITSGLKEAGIDYFEVRSCFRGYGPRIRDFRRDQGDPLHFNRAAHELSARAIYPWLTRMIAKFPADAPRRSP